MHIRFNTNRIYTRTPIHIHNVDIIKTYYLPFTSASTHTVVFASIRCHLLISLSHALVSFDIFRIYMYIYTYVRMYVCMHVQMYVYVHVQASMHTCMYMHARACACACMYVCMFAVVI